MPTWTTTQDFPAGIGIKSCTIHADSQSAIRENEFNYRQEVHAFPGQRWRLSVELIDNFDETAGELEAFLLSLRGQVGRFRFFDPFRSEPLGVASGSPVVDTAIAGMQTLTTRGWVPNVESQFKKGDYLQLGERLHRVLDDVHSDANGEADLTIYPTLRESYPAGTKIITRNATGVFRLDKTYSRFQRSVRGRGNSTDISAMEAL